MGKEISEAALSIFKHWVIQLGLNSKNLTLISKDANVDVVENFRPTVLGKFLFHVITKIISN